jgi:hypothetical protein
VVGSNNVHHPSVQFAKLKLILQAKIVELAEFTHRLSPANFLKNPAPDDGQLYQFFCKINR